MNSLFVLELFKGTGSVGKVLDILGIEHLSLDLEKKFNPDVCVNILEWDYTKIRTPDFIWHLVLVKLSLNYNMDLKELNIKLEILQHLNQ